MKDLPLMKSPPGNLPTEKTPQNSTMYPSPTPLSHMMMAPPQSQKSTSKEMKFVAYAKPSSKQQTASKEQMRGK